MNYILDLIIVAIIAVTVLISARRGFVRVALEFAGFCLALWVAFTFSSPLASVTYDKLIEPSVISSAAETTDATTSNVVNSTWDALPSIVKNNADRIGLSKDNLDHKISENLSDGAANAAKSASQSIIKPIAVQLIGLLYNIIIMIVLMFVVRILAGLVNRLFSFSIVGKLNRGLGGVFGLLKGIIIAMLFCMAVSFLVTVTKNGIWIFNSDNIDNTIVFKYLASFSPFN